MGARRQEMDSSRCEFGIVGCFTEASSTASSAEASVQCHRSRCRPFILYISGEFDLKYKASYVLRHTAEALPTALQHDSRLSGCRKHVPCHLKVEKAAA